MAKQISIFIGNIEEIEKLNKYITENLKTETHVSKLFNKGIIDIKQTDHSKIFFECCKFCLKNSLHSICRIKEGKVIRDVECFGCND